MKTTKIFVVSIALLFISLSTLDTQRINEKVDCFFIEGLNFGDMIPMPFSGSQLDIKEIRLKINPQLGVNLIYNIDRKWEIDTLYIRQLHLCYL